MALTAPLCYFKIFIILNFRKNVLNSTNIEKNIDGTGPLKEYPFKIFSQFCKVVSEKSFKENFPTKRVKNLSKLGKLLNQHNLNKLGRRPPKNFPVKFEPIWYGGLTLIGP